MPSRASGNLQARSHGFPTCSPHLKRSRITPRAGRLLHNQLSCVLQANSLSIKNIALNSNL